MWGNFGCTNELFSLPGIISRFPVHHCMGGAFLRGNGCRHVTGTLARLISSVGVAKPAIIFRSLNSSLSSSPDSSHFRSFVTGLLLPTAPILSLQEQGGPSPQITRASPLPLFRATKLWGPSARRSTPSWQQSRWWCGSASLRPL
jgi:hypothetical protein